MDRISKAVERARHAPQEGIEGARLSVKHAPKMNFEPASVSIDRLSLEDNRLISRDGTDSYSHAYKVLRTRVWQQMRANSWSNLAITSANPGEGKSLTAINLATSLSLMEIGKKVILIDMDMRRPSVHEYLGFWPEYGLSDYLQGNVSIDQLTLKPDLGKFLLIPGNVPIENSSEVLSSNRVKKLLHDLKLYFPSRLVIFDMPPLLPTDDVLVFSPQLDAVLLVIAEGQTSMADVTNSANLLKGTNLLGTVLNKSEDSNKKFGY